MVQKYTVDCYKSPYSQGVFLVLLRKSSRSGETVTGSEERSGRKSYFIFYLFLMFPFIFFLIYWSRVNLLAELL